LLIRVLNLARFRTVCAVLLAAAALDPFSLYSTQTGLSLSIGGYSQKQPILLSAILSAMRSLRVADRPADFARLRERMKRGLLNFVKVRTTPHISSNC
jgi:secreted Zn-dependent insulinase-like peptidase